MRYFLSVGEPSGDLHGAHLLAQLRQRDPLAAFSGYGGDQMRRAGCDLLFPLAEAPVMWLRDALARLPQFWKLLRQTKERFAVVRPDAVVLIDYPGFNWHVARIAKGMGIPVFYYVPPQIWGWATWRVAKMRRFVDHVLCTLPFEEAWYHARGVAGARYVGHPFFDDLKERRLDNGFVAARQGEGRPVVALLPGSRRLEVEHNGAMIAGAAAKLAALAPAVRFLVGAFRQDHVPMIESQLAENGVAAEIHVGKTPEIIALADAAIAVSGSVSLELLYHQVPTAIVYRIHPFPYHVLRPLLVKSPYITLVNLMAGQMLFPEFLCCRDKSHSIAATVAGWLTDEAARREVVGRLGRLKSLYAIPGAAAKAADEIVTALTAATPLRQAA